MLVTVLQVLKSPACQGLVERNARKKFTARFYYLPEPFAGLCDRAAQLFQVGAADGRRIILALDMGEGDIMMASESSS
jgi:hypothetical protein